jgi:hypothetical protein
MYAQVFTTCTHIVRALINVHNFEIKLHGRKNVLRAADYAALSNASVAHHIALFVQSEPDLR